MNLPDQNVPMEGFIPSVPYEFPQQLTVPVPSGAAIPTTPYPMTHPVGVPGVTQPAILPGQMPTPGMLPLEQSYIENILRFNRGKRVRVYQTFEYNPEWPAKIFEGIIVEAGRDHLILSNPDTGENYLLLMVNLDYVEFAEPIDYIPPTLPGFVLQSIPAR